MRGTVYFCAGLMLLQMLSAAANAAPMFPGRPCAADAAMVPPASAVVCPAPAKKVYDLAVCRKPKTRHAAARPLRVRATAYSLRGRTSQGTDVAPGTIAVDPRVIPYGSRIYVPGYGWGYALDTGGAIQGHTIDLWMPSSRQCFAWGVRDIEIRVEPPPPRPLLASRAGRRRPRPLHHASP